MNYGEYMKRRTKLRTTIIGYNNGQDASQVTLKNQALANSVKVPVPVVTSFSKIGGGAGNILQPSQQTCSPISGDVAGGYIGVANGTATTNASANLIGAAQHAALSNSVGVAPYNVVVPCQGVLSTVTSVRYNGTFLYNTYVNNNAPGVTNCCQKDMSQLFRNNSELVANQGRQAALRTSFNLPKKLDSLRGPVVNGR